MSIQKILYFALSLGLLMASGHAHADTVFLKNGDRVSGTVLNRHDQNMLTVQTSYGMRVEIPWRAVQSIENTYSKAVQTFDSYAPAQPIQNNIKLTPPAGYQKVENTQTHTQTMASIPAPQTAEVTAPEPNPEKTGTEDKKTLWGYDLSGRVNVGGKIESGNDQSKAFAFDAEMKARDEKNRFKFGTDFDWESEEGDITENEISFNSEYDRFVSEKWFVGTRLNLEKDRQEELELRSKLGVFAGHQFYEQDDLNLLVKAGLDHIHESFENASSENDIAATWGLDYDQKFWEDLLTVFHNHDFSVPISETSGFLFESKTGVRVPVGKSLVGTAEIEFDWDNDPAPTVQEDDTTYSVKIGYEW